MIINVVSLWRHLIMWKKKFRKQIQFRFADNTLQIYVKQLLLKHKSMWTFLFVAFSLSLTPCTNNVCLWLSNCSNTSIWLMNTIKGFSCIMCSVLWLQQYCTCEEFVQSILQLWNKWTNSQAVFDNVKYQKRRETENAKPLEQFKQIQNTEILE